MSYSPALPSAQHSASWILSLCFSVIGLSLYQPLMSWVLLLCFCSVIVRTSLFFGWYPHPPAKRTVDLLAVLSILALLWFGKEQGLLNSMINLFVTACSLKLMVMRQQRDFLQFFLSLLFLTGCGYIFEQNMAFTLLYTIIIIAIFTALMLQYSPQSTVASRCKTFLIMSLQAMPIGIVLFLVFPQLPPLWKMPTTGGAKTGLSDKVKPGDIASLSQSSDLAFRAEFQGPIPEPQQLYWRALVLEEFDQETWSVSRQRKLLRRRSRLMDQEFSFQPTGNALNYRVFAEASRQRWLFTLDTPLPSTPQSDKQIWSTYTYALQAEQPLMSTFAYDVSSYPDTQMSQTNGQLDRQLNLQLPEQGNDRARQWATEIKNRHVTNQARVNAVLEYFNDASFSYTLEPPLMPTDSIDTFLFDVQRGFCAHYASAMVFVLRNMGIPARMVTGYQGGELLNPQVISVYQYAAHAWVEAWLDDRGWVQFDPTAVVAPDRIQYGLESALEDSSLFLADTPLALRKLQHMAVFSALRNLLGQADYLWSRWVLGFDQKGQQNLFKQLVGKITIGNMLILVGSVFAFIGLLIALYFLPQLRPRKTDPVLQRYLNAARLVEKSTGKKRNTLAPNDYLTLLQAHLPESAYAHFSAITHSFVSSRYAGANEKEDARARKDYSQHLKALKSALQI